MDYSNTREQFNVGNFRMQSDVLRVMLEHGIRGGIDEKSLPEPSRIQDNRDTFIAQY